jgi:hypothetical protein
MVITREFYYAHYYPQHHCYLDMYGRLYNDDPVLLDILYAQPDEANEKILGDER